MNKKLLLSFILLPVFLSQVWAQTTVTGTVTDAEDSSPLPGVNIVVGGTTVGTITDVDGKYQITVPSGSNELVFSYTGYAKQTITIGSQTSIDVSLSADIQALSEVVITALGVEKETKSLGYSVTEIQGSELTEAREKNVINSLAGKVAGVVVSSPNGGPAGSTRVIIRGNSSLTGNNQPLYVVDGIPIDNSNLEAAGMWGGRDSGDGISGINPDDIESISVLKGPTAAALYGNRGQNGVIVITTKKGSARKGIGVEWNSNFVAESVIDVYDEFQSEFGSGTQGNAPADIDEAIANTTSSWGARIQGQNVIQYNGETLPYVNNPDNFKDFYNTGTTFTNTVALSGGNEKATFRFSASDLSHDGIIPNSTLNRNTFNLRGTANLGKRLSADVKVNYVVEKVKNRPGLSDTPENPARGIAQLAPTINQSLLQNFKDENNNQIAWNDNPFVVNPYFAINESSTNDTKNRLIAFASLTYRFTDWLSLMVRTGQDQYTFRSTRIVGFGTPYQPQGSINESEWRVQERNSDFLLQFNRTFNDIGVSATFGGNHRTFETDRISADGNQFLFPGFNHISNTTNQNITQELEQREINSFYGAVQLSYKNFLFLDLTARNDWSSTLPSNNNSFFYPSAGLSFVFTDAFELPEFISFGKVRASWAQVGNDTDPYQLNLTYRIDQTHLGQGTASIGSDRIPLSTLLPEDNTSIEIGADLRFLNNRIGLDIAWYKQNSKNFIVPVNVSGSSGFRSSLINAGEIQNQGIEILLTTTPVKLDNGFSWDLSVNFARNRNEVISLQDSDPLTTLSLGSARDFTQVVARVGQPYGAILGSPYRRTFDGQIIYNENGIPERGRILYNSNGTPMTDEGGNVMIEGASILGIANPDWTAGIINTFRFKGFTFTSIIDIRQGGEILSRTNQIAYGNGRHTATLEGRDAFYAGTGGKVGVGVVNTGTDLINPNFVQNTTATDPEVFFANLPAEQFVYDASFIKMRQMSLSYQFPKSLFDNIPVEAVTLSLVGRNLFLISRNVPNIDPESTYSSRNDSQGFEYAAMPTTRSWGFNLNVKF